MADRHADADLVRWASTLRAPSFLSIFDADLGRLESRATDWALATSGSVIVRRRGVPVGIALLDDFPPTLESIARQASKLLADHPNPPLPPSRELPSLSVVVPTHDEAEVFGRCLASLLRAEYRMEALQIIVVDSAPSDASVFDLVNRIEDDRVEYLAEPKPGAARARNTGLAQARGEIVAFVDGDVVVDRLWAREIGRSFDAVPSADCVTGLVLPLELITDAQVLLEQFGGYSKGLEPRVFDRDAHDEDPLFPFRAGLLGTGANLAYRRTALERLGGFDERLGPGTATLSGDDSELLLRTLLAGHQIAYRPSAMVFHPSHRTQEALRNQLYGYGVGLSAHLIEALRRHPRLILEFAQKAPQLLRFALNAHSSKNARRGPSYPTDLRRAELRGIAFGPIAYGRSHWEHRRRRGS